MPEVRIISLPLEEARDVKSIIAGGVLNIYRGVGEAATLPMEHGDLIAFKEPWRVGGWCLRTGRIKVNFQADGAVAGWILIEDIAVFDALYDESVDDARQQQIAYIDPEKEYSWASGKGPCRWRPAETMPDAACRTFAEITGIETLRKTKAANSAVTGWKLDLKPRPDIKAWPHMPAAH